MNSHTQPLRIISLVPSLTETLCHFGLIDNIVGCTSFCIEPKELRRKVPSVGGTKDARIGDILKLQPTHIIVNLEENTDNLIRSLRTLETENNFQVIDTFIERPLDNFELIRRFGKIFSFQEEAERWCLAEKISLDSLTAESQSFRKFRYAYFIWMNPWMVAGNTTYISGVLSLIGGINSVETGMNPAERYPAVEARDPRILDSDILFFSSEPFPFRQRHMDEFSHLSNENQPQLKVDGQALSWYGSRFSQTLCYLRRLHDEILKKID